MSETSTEQTAQFYADTYDVSVPDWPDEIEYYRELAAQAKRDGGNVLEVACGTGRVAIQLAQDAVNVVGLDHSGRMLEVARRKSAGMKNIRWVKDDMRSFDLEAKFALVIIPGHAFQNLNAPADQAACLESIRRHLLPGGRLVVHLDNPEVIWLRELLQDASPVFHEAERFTHPGTGRPIQAFRAWSYEPSTQSAVCRTRWEELDEKGEVTNRWETEPVPLHCVFPFEMEHLLRRAGFVVEELYGDFARHAFGDTTARR